MNIFKKVYCRAYQAVFHIAIPILPYRKPKLLHTNNQLAELFKHEGMTSVLLITDKSIRSFGITAPLEKTLKEQNIKLTVYDETVANPTVSNVEEARQLYIDNHCEALIGFGGGSSIDCAKAVGIRIVKPRKQMKDLEGIIKVRHKLPLLIAIPTTAGTGSETTVTCVITEDVSRHKYPVSDFCLIPHYALLDPEVTRSLPASLTATTGLDALTHAVEAYIGGSTTRASRADAIKATKLVFENLEQAYNDGGNMTARANMLQSSYLAGRAFSVSYVGYAHAVAHSLGGKYNTPHGLANAVLLPYVLEAYGKSAHKKLHRLAIEIGISDSNETDEMGALRFIAEIKRLRKAVNVGDKLTGIRKEDITSLARCAEKEGNPLYPVPKLMTATELEQFYYDVI